MLSDLIAWKLSVAIASVALDTDTNSWIRYLSAMMLLLCLVI